MLFWGSPGISISSLGQKPDFIQIFKVIKVSVKFQKKKDAINFASQHGQVCENSLWFNHFISNKEKQKEMNVRMYRLPSWEIGL